MIAKDNSIIINNHYKVVHGQYYLVWTCGFYNQNVAKMGKVHQFTTEIWFAIIILYNESKYERVIASQLKVSKTFVH